MLMLTSYVLVLSYRCAFIFWGYAAAIIHCRIHELKCTDLVLHLTLSLYPVLHVFAEMEAVVQSAAQPYPVCFSSAADQWDRRIPRSLDTLGRFASLY